MKNVNYVDAVAATAAVFGFFLLFLGVLANAAPKPDYQMTCVEVDESTSYNGGATLRCENSEVVCYKYSHSISCKTK